MVQQPLMGQGVLISKASRSHSDIQHSAEILWVSDQPDAETSTSQHTTLTTDIHAPSGIRTHNPCKRAAVDPPTHPVNTPTVYFRRPSNIFLSSLHIFLCSFPLTFPTIFLCRLTFLLRSLTYTQS